MIIELFCNIFFALAHFFNQTCSPKIPPASNGLNASMSPLLYVVKFVNMFISVSLLSRCMIILLIVYNLKFVWSILMWLIRKIPGVS